MTTVIHATAVVADDAQIGQNVEIGPYCVIGPKCVIGDGTKLFNHVTLQSHVTLGKNCQVSAGAVLGGFPQDLKFDGKDSYVVVGDDCVIRECVTINRATGEGQATTLGNGSMMMAYSHLGHNCEVGNEVILANTVHLGGHVIMGDYVFVGGQSVFHQHVRVGRYAMIGGASACRQDIPPYAMSVGVPADMMGINRIGLKRRGFDLPTRTRIKEAYHLLWYSHLNLRQGLDEARRTLGSDPRVVELLDFVETTKRGIRGPRKFLPGKADADDALAEVL